jgi:tetratricopeptide (TPR) repeat protein
MVTRKRFHISFAALALVLGVSSSASAQILVELLARGDRLATERFDNAGALDVYHDALRVDPESWEAYWRASRALTDIAEHLPAETDSLREAKLAVYETAREYADRAVRIAPDKAIPYVKRGVAMLRIVEMKGAMADVKGAIAARKDFERALDIGDGGNDAQAEARHGLGAAHMLVRRTPYVVRLPLGLGWGDLEVAAEQFRRAAELRPDFILYRLDLARTRVLLDEPERAIEQLRVAVESPLQDEDDEDRLEDAVLMLEALQSDTQSVELDYENEKCVVPD